MSLRYWLFNSAVVLTLVCGMLAILRSPELSYWFVAIVGSAFWLVVIGAGIIYFVDAVRDSRRGVR